MNKIMAFLGGAGIVLALAFVAVPVAKADTNILVDRNLMIGSNGANVVVLQGLLSELGYLNIPINVSMGFFGTLTQSALGRYQSSRNVSPSVGYFGPMTKMAMHEQFASRGWLAGLGW
jgi:hypothetical protein